MKQKQTKNKQTWSTRKYIERKIIKNKTKLTKVVWSAARWRRLNPLRSHDLGTVAKINPMSVDTFLMAWCTASSSSFRVISLLTRQSSEWEDDVTEKKAEDNNKMGVCMNGWMVERLHSCGFQHFIKRRRNNKKKKKKSVRLRRVE